MNFIHATQTTSSSRPARLVAIIKSSVMPLVLALSCLSTLALFPSRTAFAANTCSESMPEEVQRANGCTDAKESLEGAIGGIVNSVVGIAGTIALIAIVVGGILYMTSAGNPQKATQGRNTILYACVGLTICALASIIVNFTINSLPSGSGVASLNNSTDEKGNAAANGNLAGAINTIITNVVLVLGTVCVAMIVIGGVNYMTSAGDSSRVEKGKKTIIYGLVGLAICALAFIITNFAINKIIGTSSVDAVGNDGDNLTGSVITIINGIIAVLGLACVIVMVVGGINYMTSTGDSSKVEKGKKTLIYGLIGMIICVLSYAIVNYAITNIINQPATSQEEKTDDDNKDNDGGNNDNSGEE